MPSSKHKTKKNNISTKVNKNDETQKIRKSISKASKDQISSNYFLIPIFIVLCIIPFIMRVKQYNTHMSQFLWFFPNDSFTDIFLIYKQQMIIIIASAMTVIIAFKFILQRKSIRLPKIFLPLIIYAVLALISSVFSKYKYFSFNGSFEMFESVFILLGYCIIAYYTYLIINSEHDLNTILYFLIGTAIVMSLLGVFQYIGYDFFKSQLGYNLIVPENIRSTHRLTFNFEIGRVYLTLLNPDYVGVYVAMIMPVIMVMLFYQRKVIVIILSILSVLGLGICGIGSKSLTGILSLSAALILIPIFMWRHLVKHYIITASVVVILIVGAFFADQYTNHFFHDKLASSLFITKEEPSLSDIHTEADGVKLTYKNKTLLVQHVLDEDHIINFNVFDENNRQIECYLDSATGFYGIADSALSDIVIGLDTDYPGAFYLQIEGRRWRFTNMEADGNYYYINSYNRLDKIITPPSLQLFKGYEKFASNRGYIWSRTIPLLNNYIFLGSGPDTYTMVYPQQDYLGLIQAGMENQILTKPHNMYMQMWVQTGMLSLIAFLLFYIIYFITSIRLYLRGRFQGIYAKYGVAIFIGTISYMIAGLANDSNVNTAPIFWLLMGAGIAVNNKAKPLIQEEIAYIKQQKRIDQKNLEKNELDKEN